MRCSARFGLYRCQLEMSEHLDDRHVHTVEWDDEGNPMPGTELQAQMDSVPAVPDNANWPAEVPVSGLPEPTVEVDGVERGYRLSEQGGILFDEVKATRCGICGHVWHDAPCRVATSANGHSFECGCETAAP